ncbi:MAG: hypothetical protein JW889_00925 [Verrucomicrobia bacterium]|nr:hypothetical protein [Verrucomicrobiota bacterium]
MQTTRPTYRHRSVPGPGTGANRRRRFSLWVLAELLVIAALAGGIYVAVDRLILHPDAMPPRTLNADTVDPDAEAPLDEWQRQRPEGWELLFLETTKAWPGYKVDTGLPARRKLVELGDKVRPLVVRKLADPDFACRINAICILAQIGEPPANVFSLLERELRHAATGHEAFAVLKCAAVVPSPEPIVVEISLLALGSGHASARRLAIDNLCRLRSHPAAPRDLGTRLLALLDDSDAQIRLRIAARFAREGAPRTYRVLLAAVNSADRGTAIKAAILTSEVRGEGAFPSALAPAHEVDKAIDEQRKWLEKQVR